jgi:outer membrane lipoprotein-sorting protein
MMNLRPAALWILLMALTASFSASAQYDPNAKAILDAMKAKYEKLEAFEASIVQEVLDAKGNPLGSFEAKATVKKNKYRLDLGDQVIYNNETTVWRHLVEDDEVSIHHNNTEGEGEAAFQSPSNLYQMYKDGFKYVLLGTETVNGTACDLIELAPVDREKFDFFKIKLYISKADKTLVRWIVLEKDDAGVISQYRYTVKDFKAAVSVPDSFFTFDPAKHPGVEVVDMRD